MKGCPLRFGLLEGSVLFCLWVADPTAAQIVPDATLPNNSTVNLQGTRSVIEGGTTAGGNLFHSFREFSVPTGGEAFFNNAGNIQNIFSRVTGGSITSIDGLIRANGTANLFLLNPNGIIFGFNSRLNIGGSFLASTANSLRFSGGREFSATNPQAPPLLTVNVPVGLQFGPNPGSIVSRSFGLFGFGGIQVPIGKTLALVGGDLLIQNTDLTASGGRIELGSVAANSLVSLTPTFTGFVLNYEGVENFRDIQLSGARLLAGDRVQVRGRQVRIANNSSISLVRLFTASDLLVVTGSELVEVSGNSRLSSFEDLTIRTRKLTVRDGSEVLANGNLSVSASESVEIIGVDADNNSSSLSSTSGFGRATGDLTITTGKLTVRDEAQILTNNQRNEDARDIIIRASDSVEVSNGARILTNTSGAGNAGNLIIRASNSVVVRDGGGILALTALESQGAGGNLTIETRRFEGILPVATSFGQGKAGTLRVITTEPLPSIEGQILPDRTLPTNSTVRTDFNTNIIEGGTPIGSNLFHSFAQFSVPAGSTAYFNNAPEIENIISRVTGNSISNIEGMLQANGKANLFLLNPNGIIFGRNALLNIGGSFVGSTATRLNFADGTFFSATLSQTPPPLTMSVPAGLQFEPNPGRLVNQARLVDIGLQVKPGETLALVGGEVSLNGAILKAPGGRIELGGVAESAIVGLNLEGNNLRLSFPEGVQRADISLTNQARVDVTSNVSGNIALNANNIKLEQSSINSGEPYVVDRAGNITLNATGDIFLTTANLRALGGGGEIDIRAGAIFSTGSVVSASDFEGFGGNISIQADRSVSLADTLLVSVAGFGEASGNINIRARSISLSDGSIVNVNATGGVGGGISFDASDSVSLSESEVLADGGYLQSPGTGGVINITTGSLSLTNGARLTASSQGRGNAGRIIINARDTVSFDGVSNIAGRPSGAFSTVGGSAVGDGGDIDITAASLTVTNRAELSATNRGNGAAGNINVKADSIVLDNQASISSNTRGGQGNINLQTNFLTISRDSRITTNATGSNIAGGNITIDTDFLIASENSDISANSDNFIGGNLTINAQGIFGTEPREALTSRSDITATGAISSGTITLNTPDVDPRNGLVELPTNLVDITGQIVQDCPTGTRFADNEFFITGRGGLPPTPREALANNAIEVDWVTPNSQVQESRGAGDSGSRGAGEPHMPTEIVEATGWVRGANGEVILTANPPNATPRATWYRSILCPAPQPNN